MSKTPLVWLALLALLGAGAGRAQQAPETVAAVLPLACLGTPAATCDALRSRLEAHLTAHYAVRTLPTAEVDRAVRTACRDSVDLWQCLERDEALVSLARQLGAAAVLTGKLAAMGDNRVFQLRVASAGSGTVSSEVVEMAGTDDEAMLGRLTLLDARRLPLREAPPPPLTPWYSRWETWTIAGASLAVVVGALAIGFTVGREGPGGWDVRVELP